MTDRLPAIRANVESGVLLGDESRWLVEQLAALRTKVAEADPKLAYAVTVFKSCNEKFWMDWVADGAPESSKESRREYLLGGISHAEEALAALRSTGDKPAHGARIGGQLPARPSE